MLGQAHPPLRRAFGLVLAASCVLALPAVSGADRPRSSASLKAENEGLASRERSAALDLYSLDSQLAQAQARLSQLEARTAELRRQQVALAVELRVARAGARASQQHLADRVRLLYDRGDTSTLEILFGAKSLDEALVELDNLQQVTSINNDVLDELRGARTRISRTSHALSARAASLAQAVRAQASTTRALEATRADREAYIAGLRRQLALNSLQIGRIEAHAHAADVRTQKLTQQVVARSPASAAPPVAFTGHGQTLTVSATAYSLPGRTASGLPVGWGIVAVDPSVIPLGTHMTIPGYGEAVAADTGSAVKGATIDIWFPTYDMAAAWGRKSITITLG